MTATFKVLVESKYAENSQTTQYTSTNCKTRVDKFTGTNVTAGAVTLSINVVPVGGTASNANVVVLTKSIAAYECYTFPEMINQGIEAGGFISTIASAASSIMIRATGVQIT